MSWWSECASRNSSICGKNIFLEIAVFRDGGSIAKIDVTRNVKNLDKFF